MASISWLHLTDLHFGQKGQDWQWDSVRRPFYEDLERLVRRTGPWDLVLFSGDLAYSGLEKEYVGLELLLADLWTEFGRLGCDPVLLAVPGNHDVVWPSEEVAAYWALKGWHQHEKIRETFWSKPNCDTRKLVNKAFAGYAKWWGARTFPASVKVSRGLLPGDFAATFSKEGLELGIVGLNSTFLQLGKGVKAGDLDLDPRQLQGVCPGQEVRWLDGHAVNLLMTHQPQSWLSERAQREFRGRIAPGGRFALHLCGHLHEPRGHAERIGGGAERRMHQGASLFGLETWETASGMQEERIHGYTAGRIEVEGAMRRLTLWPRVLVRTQDGAGKIVADASFDLDEDEAYGYELQPSRPARKAAASVHEDAFITAYRQGFAEKYAPWDLRGGGAVQTGGAGRPIEAGLDDIYQPLRLAESFDINKTDQGQQYLPEEIVAARVPVLITAPAGGGKTTWMRWTFRRLLEREDALPLMIVLRDVARRWVSSDCRGADRGLEVFLDEWVQELLGKGHAGALLRWLNGTTGPTPVLLVDGWDELGELGREFREKLAALMKKYPHLRVIVTSRPYGDARPSGSEGFALRYLQPLSETEIADFADRFFGLCHRGEPEAAAEMAGQFKDALGKATEPAVMARTPLLLTMMLLISRSCPLPDKRHELYDVCIRNLLTARPKQWEKDGVQNLPEQWRPEDGDERLRVVASIAFELQEKAYREGRREAIVRTLSDLAALCPWGSRDERVGFILWLAGPAGVLTDRADETYAFAHLSFQEYLSAWHLHATVEGDAARVGYFCDMSITIQWWESLRLWAATIESQNPARLEPVIDGLAINSQGVWLLGTMFADGLGTSEKFEQWLGLFQSVISAHEKRGERETCASAWNASRQAFRRDALSMALRQAAANANWVGVVRVQIWHKLCALESAPPLPRSNTNAARILSWVSIDQRCALAYGSGRVIAGCVPTWPPISSILSLISVWPSRRRTIGLRLQSLAGLCATSLELKTASYPLMNMDKHKTASCSLIQSLSKDVNESRFGTRSSRLMGHEVRNLAREILVFWSTQFEKYSLQGLSEDFAFAWSRFWLRTFSSEDDEGSIEYTLSYIDKFIREIALHLSKSSDRCWISAFARDWAVDERAPYLDDLAEIELASVGRVVMRSILATRSRTSLVDRLMAEACRVSLQPGRDGGELERLLGEYPSNEDPMWPALARHLARRSTEEDRALLVDLAQHPEKRPEPLSWGLQFMVRGDIVMDDGSIVTLDELSDELGLPRLPYLDEMEPELEVDWDA